jgi:hypothetical protein
VFSVDCRVITIFKGIRVGIEYRARKRKGERNLLLEKQQHSKLNGYQK